MAAQSFVVRSLHRVGLDIIPPCTEIGRPAGAYRGEGRKLPWQGTKLHPEKYWQRQRPMQGGARAVSGRDKIEVHTSARPRSNLPFIYVNDCSITRSIAGRFRFFA